MRCIRDKTRSKPGRYNSKEPIGYEEAVRRIRKSYPAGIFLCDMRYVNLCIYPPGDICVTPITMLGPRSITGETITTHTPS